MEQKKKNRFQSLGAKIVGTVILCIVVPIIIILAYVIPTARGNLQTATKNNMLDLARSSSDIIDLLAEKDGVENVTSDTVAGVLGDVSIQGVDSSYAYVVDSDGIFIYHPTADKIGTEVFNVIINQVLSDMKSGTNAQTGVESYVDENGVTKYSSYYVSNTTHWITVIAATESDALSPITTMARNTLIVTLTMGLILLILSIYMTRRIISPIIVLTDVIKKTGELDFSNADQLIEIAKVKDETGEMSLATISMQDSLKQMVERIYTISDHLEDNAHSLQEVTGQINSMSTDNSATTQELAASMEETSATMETIDTSTSHIKDNAAEISKYVVNILDLAKQLMSRAGALNESTKVSNDKSLEVYAQVKEKTDAAIEQSKAVERVNDLAIVIQDIASQTSLLSLNASIEAARAGEMGRGFSVVAEEIGKLATQSTQTATDIVDITSEINKAVKLMSDTMTVTLDYLDQNVMKDYQTFMGSSNQNNTDAEEVYHAVDNINSMILELQNATGEIADAVSGISDTVEQAAIGVGDIAQKTTEVVDMSTNVVDVVASTSEYSEDLEKMAKEFKLTSSENVSE